MLFIPGMKKNRLSVPNMVDDDYVVWFKSGHIFIYALGVDLNEPMLLGDWRDMKYVAVF